MLEVLHRWNRWGSATLSPGRQRDALAQLRPFLDTKDVVALIGPRRAGKTTLMFQAMDELEARGIPREAVLHVNLEEPALQPRLGTDLLDDILRVHRNEVFPKGRVHVFLDEVQHVRGWERWARARTETEDVKVWVTGSSSRLMSRELGTLLTGRHVQLAVWPLSFAETLRFRDIPLPSERVKTAPPEVARTLTAYLQWGGFPEVVLAESDARRAALLRQYFDDVLFKDVAMRHEIRDLVTLRSLAVHLFTSTASLTSYQRLAGIFGMSLDRSVAYCSHLEEAFLVSLVQAFSLKTAERRRNPQKLHATDTGLRNAVAMTGAPDRGRLAETAAFNAMRRSTDEPSLFYGRGEHEVDIVRRAGHATSHLVQVAWAADEATLQRELASLDLARAEHPKARRLLVTERAPKTPLPRGIEARPLWRFLLDPL